MMAAGHRRRRRTASLTAPSTVAARLLVGAAQPIVDETNDTVAPWFSAFSVLK